MITFDPQTMGLEATILQLSVKLVKIWQIENLDNGLLICIKMALGGILSTFEHGKSFLQAFVTI